MGRRWWWGAIASLSVAVMSPVGAPATSIAVVAQVDRPLRAEVGSAPRIVDDQDRTVLLRGVNLNGLGEYYQEFPDLPPALPIDSSTFPSIAALGFDVVRLLVTWSRIEPSPGVIDTAYLDQIASVVQLARAADVYVVLDMHQDAWGPAVFTPDGVTCPPGFEAAVGWDGAPAWATVLTGGIETCRATPGREFSLTVQASFEQLYANTGDIRDHFAAAWGALAARFGAQPVIAGYDLLNEPNPGLTPGADDVVLLGQVYDAALDAIRGAGGTGIGFFEPAVVMGPLPVSGPAPGFTTDTNLVYAPHLYNESISPIPGSTIEDGFANAASAASLHGTTFWSGEWGWFGDPATDQSKLERYAAAEDAAMVGGTWWQWAQACGDPHAIGVRRRRPPCAGVSPLSDGLVTRSPANIAVLSRAYPRAVPGRLTSMRSTIATGELVVTGVAGRAAAADLWVPERCVGPTVSGDGLGAVGTRPVAGGWRLGVAVPSPGPYRIVVSCVRSTASGGAAAGALGGAADGSLPATGGTAGAVAPTVVALAALLALAGVSWPGGRTRSSATRRRCRRPRSRPAAGASPA